MRYFLDSDIRGSGELAISPPVCWKLSVSKVVTEVLQ